MRKIEGTATISIEELDRLRQREQWYNELRGTLKGIVASINTEKYDKRLKEIDSTTSDEITDEELNELIRLATQTVEIVISENVLRKLIVEFVDDTKSDVHYAISQMAAEELKEIPLILSSKKKEQEESENE